MYVCFLADKFSIQYRMHPDISRLPSELFYEKRLRDGPDMAIKTKQPWHSHVKFGTYRFFNLPQGREEPGKHQSLKNRAECQAAVALYNRLRQEFSSFDFDFRVGIVSMYRAQILELRQVFRERFGPEILQKVDFNTVDGFQGQEKDIIILSCVRAGPGIQTVGFLKGGLFVQYLIATIS
jgi:senataxin